MSTHMSKLVATGLWKAMVTLTICKVAPRERNILKATQRRERRLMEIGSPSNCGLSVSSLPAPCNQYRYRVTSFLGA